MKSVKFAKWLKRGVVRFAEKKVFVRNDKRYTHSNNGGSLLAILRPLNNNDRIGIFSEPCCCWSAAICCSWYKLPESNPLSLLAFMAAKLPIFAIWFRPSASESAAALKPLYGIIGLRLFIRGLVELLLVGFGRGRDGLLRRIDDHTEPKRVWLRWLRYVR